MPNGHPNRDIDDLLELLTSRVYRSRRQSRVPGQEGFRVTEDMVDDTGIGPDNETSNTLIRNEIILDCGHPARENFGGRCHFCDALVCRACISLCSSCGLAICPPHTVIAALDGAQKAYCRTCAEEIHRTLRLKSLVAGVLSFFLEKRA